MEATAERAKRYAALVEEKFPSFDKTWLEIMDNLEIAIGPCYTGEDSAEDFYKALCEAYEAEFKRLGIKY